MNQINISKKSQCLLAEIQDRSIRKQGFNHLNEVATRILLILAVLFLSGITQGREVVGRHD